MKVKAYFDDIDTVIIKFLNQATTEIKVAVAWFTNSSLLEVLCRQAQKGVNVKIILIDDEINKGIGRLNFTRLENLGGKVHFIKGDNYNKMHHKFCVIDQNTVITGSYNWTNQAKNNQENIMVVEGDITLMTEFLNTFNQLLQSQGSAQQSIVSSDAVKRRLEMIKNFILLDEIEEIQAQVNKLKGVIEKYQLMGIVESIEKGEYQSTVEQITDYLKRFTSLISSEDIEVSEIKFEIKILELQIESLSNANAEIERDLLLFNRRQFEILGDITRQILEVKAECARIRAKAQTQNDKKRQVELEQEAEEAQAQFEEYSEEYEEIQHERINVLNTEEAKELKDLYRRVCHLCHPDRVTDDKKEQATKIFIEARKAFENNDIQALMKIYQRLKLGDFSLTKVSSLKEIELLRATLAEMRHKFEKLLKDSYALQKDETVLAMYQVGENETAWIEYFESKKHIFEQELKQWLENLAQLKKEGKEHD